MKKILPAILAFMLAACGTTPQPQATVTPIPLPTATATAIPTPTLNPQFVALQESVAATGVRFTLMSDGSLTDAQNEGIAVAGLNGKDGKWTLQLADGTIVALDNTAVHLDDTYGYSVYGYTYDAATKVWAKAAEIMVLPETELFNLSYETKDLSVEIAPDMTLTTRIVTDESGGPTVAEVRINPTWPDVEKAIPEFSFAMLAKVATHTGGPEGTGIDVDLETYAKMLSEAKDGTRPWSDVGITLKKIYMAGSDTPVDVVIAPAAGDSVLPENMYPVNEVVYVIGGEFPIENMTPTNYDNGTAKAFLNGDILYLYLGANNGIDKEIKGQGDLYPGLMAQMAVFLSAPNRKLSTDPTLSGMLIKNGGKSGWSALQVFNASGEMNETERLTNHP